MPLDLSRRSFLTGFGALVAARAAMKLSSLLPVASQPSRTIPFHFDTEGSQAVYRISLPSTEWRYITRILPCDVNEDNPDIFAKFNQTYV